MAKYTAVVVTGSADETKVFEVNSLSLSFSDDYRDYILSYKEGGADKSAAFPVREITGIVIRDNTRTGIIGYCYTYGEDTLPVATGDKTVIMRRFKNASNGEARFGFSTSSKETYAFSVINLL